MRSTEVTLAGIRFKNPLLLSAADHTHSLNQLKTHIDNGAAGIVPKTLCQFPYMLDQKKIARYMVFDSNLRPVTGKVGREFTLMSRGGMMSEEEGWMDVLAEAVKYAEERDAHIIGSLWGEPDWMAEKAAEMEQRGMKGVELDIGCPHLDGIHANESVDKTVANFLGRCEGVKKVVDACSIPVIVKMSADTGGEWGPIIQYLKEIGVGAVTVHNRFVGFLPDVETQRPFMDTWSGVGGPWIVPITCYRINQVRRMDRDMPILATNGCYDGLDVARFLLAGASVVQCASSPLILGSRWVSRTIRQFQEYLDRKDMDAMDLIGKASDSALTREQLFDIHKISQVDDEECVRCGICVERCPWEALSLQDGRIQVKPSAEGRHEGCIGCGMCTMVCPKQAIHLVDRT
jgi:dihydroorotate dehydrogenase/NAD-dependent dihydropyrimidine dehydrogenase PreA subunit